MGHTVVMADPYTGNEHGKDVVSIDPEGVLCAYQLKWGDLNTDKFRDILPQLEILRKTPIRLVDIKKMPQRVFLVTNGELRGGVEEEIVLLNEGDWKKRPLEKIDRSKLLKGFMEMSGGFMPTNRSFYKELVELTFEDGTGMPNLEKVYVFLAEIMGIDNIKTNAQRRRDISTAILYAYMIIQTYVEQENYTSISYILTILGGLIIHLGEKYELDENMWVNSYKMIWHDLWHYSKLVEDEIERNWFDSLLTNPLLVNIHGAHTQLALNIIFAYKLSQIISWKNDVKLDPKIYTNCLKFIYEGSLVPLIFISYFMQNAGSNKLIKIGVDTLIIQNSSIDENSVPLLPPYFELQDIMEILFRIKKEDLKLRDYQGSSYMIGPLIDMLVRRWEKEYLKSIWSGLTFIQMEEFILNNPIDYYNWRNKNGENHTLLPRHEEKWSNLEKRASQNFEQLLPKNFSKFPEFLPYFLIVHTHRVDRNTIGFLDQKLRKPF